MKTWLFYIYEQLSYTKNTNALIFFPFQNCKLIFNSLFRLAQNGKSMFLIRASDLLTFNPQSPHRLAKALLHYPLRFVFIFYNPVSLSLSLLWFILSHKLYRLSTFVIQLMQFVISINLLVLVKSRESQLWMY